MRLRVILQSKHDVDDEAKSAANDTRHRRIVQHLNMRWLPLEHTVVFQSETEFRHEQAAICPQRNADQESRSEINTYRCVALAGALDGRRAIFFATEALPPRHPGGTSIAYPPDI